MWGGPWFYFLTCPSRPVLSTGARPGVFPAALPVSPLPMQRGTVRVGIPLPPPLGNAGRCRGGHAPPRQSISTTPTPALPVHPTGWLSVRSRGDTSEFGWICSAVGRSAVPQVTDDRQTDRQTDRHGHGGIFCGPLGTPPKKKKKKKKKTDRQTDRQMMM